MKGTKREEYALPAALALGLLFFPLLQAATALMFEDGAITFLFRRALPPITIAAPEPLPPPPPADRTRPFAVMIDDHPDALPQSGVSQADEVWSLLVEGGLTRLMAFYRSATVPEIGPVRSARPYFLEVARGLDAAYVHVGGSDEALKILSTNKIGLDDVNEFRHGSSFWRSTLRSAPHNTYTSTEKIRALMAKNEWALETDSVDPSARAAAVPGDVITAATVEIEPTAGTLTETFRYDPETKVYRRWRSGKALRDRDGEAHAPAAVVVLEMKTHAVADPQGKGLIGLTTLGTGKATVLRDGAAYAGVWKKTSAADHVEITDDAGAPIPFPSGQVWFIGIVPDRGGNVKITEPPVE